MSQSHGEILCRRQCERLRPNFLWRGSVAKQPAQYEKLRNNIIHYNNNKSEVNEINTHTSILRV